MHFLAMQRLQIGAFHCCIWVCLLVLQSTSAFAGLALRARKTSKLFSHKIQRGPSHDDYAGVGSSGADPCFEAQIQNEVIQETAALEMKLYKTYKKIWEECGSGIHNLDCVTETFFAKEPAEFLKACTKSRGPTPTLAGAVCRFSKVKNDKLAWFSYRWGHIAWIVKQAADPLHCNDTPFICIAMIDQCLMADDINFCYRECLRTGNMQHQLKPPPKVETVGR